MKVEKQPLVSIVIPVYNVEKYLRECVDSILSQTYKNTEIILIDDGSTDQSGRICREYAKLDHRIIIKKQQNKGLSAARNTGFSLSIGEYVIFLDSDDFFDKNLLRNMVLALKKDNADMAICRFDMYDTKLNKKLPGWQDFSKMPIKAFSVEELNHSIFPLAIVGSQVWTKMLRRDFLVSNDIKYDNKLRRAEDVPFTGEAIFKAKKIVLIDEPLVHYRFNSGTSNTDRIGPYATNIIDAFVRLKDILITCGELKLWEKAFGEFYIENIRHYFKQILMDHDAFAELFTKSKQTLEMFNVISMEKTDYRKNDNYKFVKTISRVCAKDYLILILSEELRAVNKHAFNLENEINYLNKQVSDLNKQVSDLSNKLENTLNSKEHKMGALVVKPIRIIRRMLISRNDK
jgi:glycosyltransferase involved in cell wall biosynthesis